MRSLEKLIKKINILVENEELIKMDRKKMDILLRNQAILKNKNSKLEDRIVAVENIKNIMNINTSAPSSQLEAAANLANEKRKNIENKQIQTNITQATKRAEKIKREAAEEKAQQRWQEREAEKQKRMENVGTPFTQAELQAHADRVAGITKEKPTNLQQRKTTKAQQTQVEAGKTRFQLEKILDTVSKLHADGDHSGAHDILSSIPTHFFTGDLKQYRPEYIHYDVTPDLWKRSDQNFKNSVHEFHNEVVNGKHDNSDHEGTRAMAARIKALKSPSQ